MPSTQCPFKNVTHLTHSTREWMDFLLRLWQARFAYFFPNWKVNRKVRQIKIFSWTSLILPEQTLINYFDLFQLLLYKYTKNFRGSTLSLHSEYAWGRVSVFAWGWEIWKNLFFLLLTCLQHFASNFTVCFSLLDAEGN